MNTSPKTANRQEQIAKRRGEFIRCLAAFLAENQGGKSILLQLESQWTSIDPRPRLAHAWASMYQLANVEPAISIQDAEAGLQAFLCGPQPEVADALTYVLARISHDKDVRNLLGVGTETYSRLTKAYSLVTGESVDEVRDRVIPGSASIHREEA